MVMERTEHQLTTFTKTSQNVAMADVLPDTLPAPSTNGVGELYQQLKHPRYYHCATSGEFPTT
jgi:hypothetical protein